MAKRIMARATEPTSSRATTPSAADLLECKLEQLNSLLWCCHGAGDGWFEEAGAGHRDNLLWIASDLARDAAALFQESGGG
ncbi:hypothetical protein D3C85_549830 [compost metagenome]